MNESREGFNIINKIIDKLLYASIYLTGLLIAIMAVITCYEVASRYIFNVPTNWTADLAIFLLIFSTFLSMGYLQKEGKHVKVDLLISHFSPRATIIWNIVTSTVSLIFALALTYHGVNYTYQAFASHEYSWSMWRVITWPIKIGVPIGGALLIIQLIREIIVDYHAIKTSEPQKYFTYLTNPIIAIPIFLLLLVVSLYLYTISGAAGMVALMFVLLFAGVPIYSALGLVGAAGYFFVFGDSFLSASLPATAFRSLDSYSLVCLPLFVMVGVVLQYSKVNEEIFDVSSKWVGHWPGGDGIATVIACAIFAAVSTSSVATAVTIGLVALPALAARKYNKRLSYGLLAGGGTLGIMIPPSGSMIIYSAVTEESLGKLFIAGIIPGIIIAAAFILYVMYFCNKTGEYERKRKATWSERLISTRKGAWGLLAPVIIMGGIYSGIFTPLESGAAAVIYVIAMVLFRSKLKFSDLPQAFIQTTFNSTMVLSIVVGAMLMGDFMTLLQVPTKVVQYVQTLGLSPAYIIVALMIIYVILGMFLEVISCMLITLPIVYPLIISLGYDGIWFAVMVTINMEMALISPPVGLNLYVIASVAKTSIFEVVKGVVPFFLIMVAGMLLIGFFPILSTWLPSLMVAR